MRNQRYNDFKTLLLIDTYLLFRHVLEAQPQKNRLVDVPTVSMLLNVKVHAQKKSSFGDITYYSCLNGIFCIRNDLKLSISKVYSKSLKESLGKQ